MQLQKNLQTPLNIIKERCSNKKETVAVAESVTAGCLQMLLSTCEGAQDFFQGGITVYNCSQKAIHLGVEPIYAQHCNGVDPSIAATMAYKVCSLFRSQIGVAITGYATPVPEEGIYDLYAYMAIVKNGRLIHEEKLQTRYKGIAAQWEYAATIIQKLAELTD